MTDPIDGLLREVMPQRLQTLALEECMSLQGDLGIESIGLISLAFRIEEELQVDLMEHSDEVANVRTIGDLRDLLRRLR